MEIEILSVSAPKTEVTFLNGQVIDVRFPKAFLKAKEKIVRNHFEKGNSWLTCGKRFLEKKLREEWKEWADSQDPDELLDVMNLAAMLYDEMKIARGD